MREWAGFPTGIGVSIERSMLNCRGEGAIVASNAHRRAHRTSHPKKKSDVGKKKRGMIPTKTGILARHDRAISEVPGPVPGSRR